VISDACTAMGATSISESAMRAGFSVDMGDSLFSLPSVGRCKEITRGVKRTLFSAILFCKLPHLLGISAFLLLFFSIISSQKSPAAISPFRACVTAKGFYARVIINLRSSAKSAGSVWESSGKSARSASSFGNGSDSPRISSTLSLNFAGCAVPRNRPYSPGFS